MSKFNGTPKGTPAPAEHPSATTNYEGGLAFDMNPKLELYTRASATLLGEPKFYDPAATDEITALRSLVAHVAQEDPEFILKLAVYCRSTMNLRSVPVWLLVEGVDNQGVRKFVRDYVPQIIQRPDEITETLAAYIASNGQIGDADGAKGKLAKSLQRGLADAFLKFDAYGFGKYAGKSKEVSMQDAIRLVHPIPQSDEQCKLFEQIAHNELPVPDTWETYISKNGSTKATWEHILPNMPYMARLRNLRNLLDKNVSEEMLALVARDLANEQFIKRSRQFPYRFYTAYRELEKHQHPYTSSILDALETAMDISTGNVPLAEGKSFIVTDLSGSMENPMSEHSTVKRKEVGALLAAAVHRISPNSVVGAFADEFKVVNLNGRNGVLNNTRAILKSGVAGGTYAHSTVRYLLDHDLKVDRFVMFSDEQCYSKEPDGYYLKGDQTLASLMAQYRKHVNPHVWVYSIDLAGYGTAQFPQGTPRTALLAGWSDRVLSFIDLFEHSQEGLLEVEKLSLEKYKPAKQLVEE